MTNDLTNKPMTDPVTCQMSMALNLEVFKYTQITSYISPLFIAGHMFALTNEAEIGRPGRRP